MPALSPLLVTLATAVRRALHTLRTLIPVLLYASQAHTAGLNDTGITDCTAPTGLGSISDAADSGSRPRQDCRYGRDAQAAAGQLTKIGGGNAGFDFTKIANNGSVLPASATLGSGASDWACTRDNVTSLIWEVKTTSGLRSYSHSYSWYSSNSATNGGNAGTDSGGSCQNVGRCDTEKFVADVNTVGLCGAHDWRMPSSKELMSIVDYSPIRDDIDASYFPNTISVGGYWSALTAAHESGSASIVRTAHTYTLKSTNRPVRLVRAGQ